MGVDVDVDVDKMHPIGSAISADSVSMTNGLSETTVPRNVFGSDGSDGSFRDRGLHTVTGMCSVTNIDKCGQRSLQRVYLLS